MLSWFSMPIGSPPHIPSIGIGWADQRCAVVAIFFFFLLLFPSIDPPMSKGALASKGGPQKFLVFFWTSLIVESASRDWKISVRWRWLAVSCLFFFCFRLEISKKIRLRYFCDPAGKNAKTKKTKRKIETCMRPRRFCCVSLLSFYILRDTWISNLNRLTAWARPANLFCGYLFFSLLPSPIVWLNSSRHPQAPCFFLFFLYIIKNILNKESFELYGIYRVGMIKKKKERKKTWKSENPFHWLAHAIGCGGKKEPPAACLLPCCSFIHRCPRGMNIASSCERYTFQRIICYVSKASQPAGARSSLLFPIDCQKRPRSRFSDSR